MKKVAILFAFLFALVANTFAQNDAVAAPLKSDKVGKKEHKGKGKHAADALGLSVEQKEKMKTIKQSLKGKMMAIKTDESLTKDQKKVQAGEIAKQHEADIKGVLSAEQFTKWQGMKEERRGKGKQKRGKN